MPSFFPPIASSGSRTLDKSRPLPKSVKRMVELMVYGKPNDPDCTPLSFIEAGKIAGIAPDRARKWLDRAEVRSLLRAERRAFRDALCASNELHLQRLRESANGMVGIKAIQTLEELNVDDAQRARREQVSPGLIVTVVHEPLPRTRVGPIVDVTPTRAPDEPVDR